MKKIAEIAPNGLDAKQLDEARQQARDILDGKSNAVTPEMQQKMRESAMAAWRVGLPGVITYMKYLVESSECPKKDFKEKCTKKILKLESSLGDKDGLVGACLEYKFGERTARSFIGLCEKNHDLTAQLMKLQTLFGDKYNDHKPAINRSLGELILYSRLVWRQVTHTEQGLAAKIQNIIANQY